MRATGHGGTTQVFRASRGGGTVYVRLAEDPGESMRVEARLHDELLRRGVRLPEVLAVAEPDERLDRGALVLAALPGRQLAGAASGDPLAEAALRAAGSDVARIGAVAVAGFGFLERAPTPELRAPLASARELLTGGLDDRLDRLAEGPLGRRAVRSAARAVERHAWRLDDTPARLAHGDLDPSHIYVHRGAYAGVIDLGEARGAPPLYDVAHYAVHERQAYHGSARALVAGYAEVQELPPDHGQILALVGLLIALRLLDITAGRASADYRQLLVDAVDERSAALS